MLIRNNSDIKRTIHLSLSYDDQTTKEGDVEIGTKLYLSFRRNSSVEVKYGVIIDIIDRVFYRLSENDTRNQTEACMVFDMSEPYNSNKCTIPLSDIIDFEMVPETVGGINPDHRIPLRIYESLHKE